MDAKELRVPGWFIATVAIVLAIATATYKLTRSFDTLLEEHRRHTQIIDRLDKRTCRIEAQLGIRDVDCVQDHSPGETSR